MSDESLVHAGCGGTVAWDAHGASWCDRCGAEDLEPDETEPQPDGPGRDRPYEAGRSVFSSLHENRST
jgi:hypothetical protein